MARAPKPVQMYNLIWTNGKNKETVESNKPYGICKTVQLSKIRTHRGGKWEFQKVKNHF